MLKKFYTRLCPVGQFFSKIVLLNVSAAKKIVLLNVIAAKKIVLLNVIATKKSSPEGGGCGAYINYYSVPKKIVLYNFKLSCKISNCPVHFQIVLLKFLNLCLKIVKLKFKIVLSGRKLSSVTQKKK